MIAFVIEMKKVGLGRSERSWLDLTQCVISDDKVHMGFALSRTPAYSKMSVTLKTYGMFCYESPRRKIDADDIQGKQRQKGKKER